MTDAGPVGTFQLDALQGELRGYPVRAQADLKVDGKAYEIEALELHSGSAHLTAAGEISDHWDLRWKIQAPDLAALLPDAGGKLAGSGRIRGARSLPAISAEVRGEGLRWAETKIKQLRLKGSVDLQDEMPSSIDIDVEGVEGAGETITRIEVEGKGLLSSHALQADARTRDQRVFLRMEGGVEGKRWKGALRRSALQDKVFGNWILDEPVQMILSAGAADVETGCWRGEHPGDGPILHRRSVAARAGVADGGARGADPARSYQTIASPRDNPLRRARWGVEREPSRRPASVQNQMDSATGDVGLQRERRGSAPLPL
ncbi:MAG: hypothetical protein MPW15_20850 [Candidatus Manganitrophus sp.]|nr:hypothetical protein [Candidatus Manganitrophus sp.]